MDKAKGGEAKIPPAGSRLFYIGCPGLLPSKNRKVSFREVLAAAAEDTAACRRIGRR